MAIELKFSKPDAGSHWGFRLVGGADFNEPLVVVKVDKNSFAENAGLMVGDVVVRVNDTPTAGLTHAVAHDLIFDAGNEFIVAIRRGLFSDIPVPTEDDINSEIENILKESLAEQLEGIKKETRVTPSPVLENLSGQEQLVQPQKGDKVTGGKKKKWSTFLVKPKNPVPKAQAVPVQKIAEPYKVKIVKQPRRDPKDVLNHKKTVKFEPNVVEVKISRESSIASMTESSESIDLPLPSEIEMETSVKIIEETTVEICEEGNDDFDTPRSDSSNEICSPQHKSTPILKPKPIDIHIEPVVCESSQSLAEQLAAVQKQLLLLSQLPSAIQVTLEAVTEQLNKIALDKLSTIDENENFEENVDNVCEKFSGEEDAAEENLTESENAEHDITENGIEDEDQANLEEFEVDEAINDESAMPDVNTAEEIKSDVEDTREAEVIDPYAGLTEEEKEAKIREEQLLAKKQKLQEERNKMDWPQRPIVLPGGTKWIDPNDATPKPKTTKMSDEKICKTLDEFSEVIVGKTKGSTIGTGYGLGGIRRNQSTVPESQTVVWCPARSNIRYINFLKYQPPAKNLDYLQKSEVYRLIHDMEPPLKGVAARYEKILSENEYYGNKAGPN